jgi:hypothetical protein
VKDRDDHPRGTATFGGLRLTDAGRIGELSLRAGWDLKREEAESVTAKAKPYGKRNGLD